MIPWRWPINGILRGREAFKFTFTLWLHYSQLSRAIQKFFAMIKITSCWLLSISRRRSTSSSSPFYNYDAQLTDLMRIDDYGVSCIKDSICWLSRWFTIMIDGSSPLPLRTRGFSLIFSSFFLARKDLQIFSTKFKRWFCWGEEGMVTSRGSYEKWIAISGDF
jgi:hypothetical protein